MAAPAADFNAQQFAVPQSVSSDFVDSTGAPVPVANPTPGFHNAVPGDEVASLSLGEHDTNGHAELAGHDQAGAAAAPVHDAASFTAPKEPLVIKRKVTSFVGFSNLPQQWHARSVRKGFTFNLIVAGESGLGKSTLLNALFEAPLHDLGLQVEYPAVGGGSAGSDGAGTEPPQTVGVEPTTVDLEESGVRLKLTVIDTPGFGDHINNLDSWKPIVEEIDARFNQYLEAETAISRHDTVDNRIHACLYFIAPTGHSLKPLDVVVMRKLHKKVNLIPVIARADTLTETELASFKRLILDDIRHQEIDIFEPPRYEDDDEETAAEVADIMGKVPFAVVGSTQTVRGPDGRNILGRSYPWGVVDIMDEEQCDFVKLRALLVRNHLEDLRERTANVLYENYRTEKMVDMGIQQDASVFEEVDPALRLQEERKLHEQRLAKMEAEMRAVFQQKVTEKEMKLKKSEAELFQKHKEIKDQLDQQRQELEARKHRLEQGAADSQKRTKGGFSIR